MSGSFRLAVFDFDGTLADSFPWFCAVLNEVAARHGFRRVETEKEREELRHLSTREILKRLRVPLWKIPTIARDLRAMKLKADISVFAGVENALAALSAQGVVLGVVSSDTEPSIRRTLGPGLSARFAHWQCGASLFGKSGNLKKVVAAAGMSPWEAVYVGDETRDCEAAQAAGMAFAAVSWGYAARAALEAGKPDFVLEEVADIGRLA